MDKKSRNKPTCLDGPPKSKNRLLKLKIFSIFYFLKIIIFGMKNLF